MVPSVLLMRNRPPHPPNRSAVAHPDPTTSLWCLFEGPGYCPWSPPPHPIPRHTPPKCGLLAQGMWMPVTPIVLRADAGPHPSAPHCPLKRLPESHLRQELPTGQDTVLLPLGRDWARAGAGRALSSTRAGPREPGLTGGGGCVGEGGGHGTGVLAALMAGDRDRADRTFTPHHISPCGGPAAEISYLKPDQIAGAGLREGSRRVTEASCPS